jgi:hypothetical protein
MLNNLHVSLYLHQHSSKFYLKSEEEKKLPACTDLYKHKTKHNNKMFGFTQNTKFVTEWSSFVLKSFDYVFSYK